MQVSVTATTGLERKLEVAVPAQRVATEIDQRLKELARTARLKGFRPGKVPPHVIKQLYGPQLGEEAERNNELRVYVVTIATPPEYAWIHDRWPRLRKLLA